jgi:hypothetical protein
MGTFSCFCIFLSCKNGRIDWSVTYLFFCCHHGYQIVVSWPILAQLSRCLSPECSLYYFFGSLGAKVMRLEFHHLMFRCKYYLREIPIYHLSRFSFVDLRRESSKGQTRSKEIAILFFLFCKKYLLIRYIVL